MNCSGCGSSDVEFIPQTRKLICHQCGKEEYYSRATLNKNGKVILAKDNAKKFFMSGDMDNAKHYALEVLNIFLDNVPAKYIVSYYDEVKNARNSSIKKFFDSIKEIALEEICRNYSLQVQGFCMIMKRKSLRYQLRICSL